MFHILQAECKVITFRLHYNSEGSNKHFLHLLDWYFKSALREGSSVDTTMHSPIPHSLICKSGCECLLIMHRCRQERSVGPSGTACLHNSDEFTALEHFSSSHFNLHASQNGTMSQENQITPTKPATKRCGLKESFRKALQEVWREVGGCWASLGRSGPGSGRFAFYGKNLWWCLDLAKGMDGVFGRATRVRQMLVSRWDGAAVLFQPEGGKHSPHWEELSARSAVSPCSGCGDDKAGKAGGQRANEVVQRWRCRPDGLWDERKDSVQGYGAVPDNAGK